MPDDICNVLKDKDSGFYIGDYFNKLVRSERKRTERSKNPFMLMLLNIGHLNQRENKKEILKKLSTALFSSIREVDFVGWYKYDTIIGIMFVEMNGEDAQSAPVRSRIALRIYNNLRDQLENVELVNKIQVSYHTFPEESVTEVKEQTPLADLILYPDLFTERRPARKFFLLIKSFMDFILSFILLILLCPLFVLIALLVKLSSRGPAFFKQQRVGRLGKQFTFLKFRSMYISGNDEIHKKFVTKFIKQDGQTTGEKTDKDTEGQNLVYKIIDDPRVTPIGRFIRRTSLDELPQLINVLKGEMSLVGPRPPIPYELEHYDTWHKGRILEVRPGITGLWQVEKRSTASFDEMVRLDLKYVRECSLWLDIKILFKTPWAVLTGKGAY